ncbi:hypothetical protein NDA01_30640 [Trichocoleus desertorum AS-A10]|uniref:hypothetical protein n=1 Tax=Trichocoleus desertorum TaxID=1481672 RepID=UPI003297423F
MRDLCSRFYAHPKTLKVSSGNGFIAPLFSLTYDCSHSVVAQCFSFGWFKITDEATCLTMMPPAKRKRVTVIASRLGIDCAEKSLIRLGFDSKSHFAKTQLMSKSTVDKFFNRQPIQLDSFKAICEALKIEDWRSIAELEPLVAQYASEASEKEAELDVVEAIASQPMI